MNHVEELAKRIDDLKTELVTLKIDVNTDRNRVARAIENIKHNLKNIAFMASVPIVDKDDQSK